MSVPLLTLCPPRRRWRKTQANFRMHQNRRFAKSPQHKATLMEGELRHDNAVFPDAPPPATPPPPESPNQPPPPAVKGPSCRQVRTEPPHPPSPSNLCAHFMLPPGTFFSLLANRLTPHPGLPPPLFIPALPAFAPRPGPPQPVTDRLVAPSAGETTSGAPRQGQRWTATGQRCRRARRADK